ncbi:MAG: putative rane protein [Herbinix sp.]|jgi:hypothetical protein|nr:putative rane protein [Herbinix sp.]
MMGVFYLFLCFAVGHMICSYWFPRLQQITEGTDKKGLRLLSPYILLLPAWYITGTIVLTWCVYILASLFHQKEEPLLLANAITISVAFLSYLYFLYSKIRKNKGAKLFFALDRVPSVEIILILAVTLLACILMWRTFFVKDNELYVGVSVFSDFSPHIGMIRSFSNGNNFPTWYAHFAGEDIKYHFMFMFLAGNLEYLGLRLDYAFNLPSILSFISAFSLLYVLAVKITGLRITGVLSCLFFAFRSSKTLFTFLANVPEGTSIWKALTENTNFISSTPNEDWGLWNLNVYCNQRHFALGMSVIFFILILFLPHLIRMWEVFDEMQLVRRNIKYAGSTNSAESKNNREESKSGGFLHNLGLMIRTTFFTREGWMIQDLKLAIGSGILLGALAFFHGAALIACVSILFVMAVVSVRRLELLIMALITMFLSFLQSYYFINGSAVTTKFFFGFIAENKTLFGAASYLERLLGILPLVLLMAFYIGNKKQKHIQLAFTVPLILAFTISLTTDVTVNHKYIMISCILLGVAAADLIRRMFHQKKFLLFLSGIGLIIALTATGIYDFITVIRKNNPDHAVVLNLQDPLTTWIMEHSNSRDIYLTSNYALNQVVLGGAMLYNGWQYFAWSAGYDTGYRDKMVKYMYEASSPIQLDTLVKENNIRYILVDYDSRTSTAYSIREDNIKETYQVVYTLGEGEWNTTIYDTTLPVYE